jgi:lysophospholipase L1-like esterase
MPSPFLTDTFTDTASISLSAHTPDTGGSWAFSSATAANGLVITATGRLRNNTATQSVATSSVATTGTPSTLTWDLTPLAGATGFFGVGVGAPSATSLQGYEARYDIPSGSWQVIGFSSTAYALLGSTAMALTVGTTYHCQFVIPDPGVSATKTLYVNGSAILTVSNTAYPTSGHIYFDSSSTTAPTDTTGLQIDNLNVYNIAFVPGSTITVPPDSAGIVLSPGNQYIVPGTSLQWIHTASSAKFDFTGTSLAVSLDLSPLTSASIATANYPYLNWSIDNGAWQRAQVTTTPSLATGLTSGIHTAEVRYEPNDESDTWTPHSAIKVTGWILDSGAALSSPNFNATARPKLAMLMGDSITRGYAATNIALDSYGIIFANGLNAEIGITGYSGQGWGKAATNVAPVFTSTFGYYDASHARTLPSLDYLIIAQGTNDSTTTGLAAIVQSELATIRAAAGPKPLIVIVIHFNGQQDTAITAGANAYIRSAADTRVLIVDLSARNYGFLTASGSATQYSVDGIHPTNEAHALLAADITAAIKTFEAQATSGNGAIGSSHSVGGGVLAGQ